MAKNIGKGGYCTVDLDGLVIVSEYNEEEEATTISVDGKVRFPSLFNYIKNVLTTGKPIFVNNVRVVDTYLDPDTSELKTIRYFTGYARGVRMLRENRIIIYTNIVDLYLETDDIIYTSQD